MKNPQYLVILLDADSGLFAHVEVLGWTADGVPLVEHRDGLTRADSFDLPYRVYEVDLKRLRATVQAQLVAALSTGGDAA